MKVFLMGDPWSRDLTTTQNMHNSYKETKNKAFFWNITGWHRGGSSDGGGDGRVVGGGARTRSGGTRSQVHTLMSYSKDGLILAASIT